MIIRIGIPAGFLAILVALSIFAPLPHDPLASNADTIFEPPNRVYLLGTDQNGADVLSRLILSARVDVVLAVIGAAFSMLIGVPLGLLGSQRTRFAEYLMRSVDLLQAFPLLVLAIAIVALGGNHIVNIVVALLIVNVPQFVRLVRAEGLVVRSRRYVEAARAAGAGPWRIALRHVLPNVAGVVLAQLSLSAAIAILAIAALGFLGIGISPPTPSWGQMLNAGSQYIAIGKWWLVVFPSLAIMFAIFSFNSIADALQELTAPELRGRS